MEPSKITKVSQGNSCTAPLGGLGWCVAVGFSARALAEALRRAEFSVIAVDAFGDYDTRETAKVPRIIANWGAAGAELSLQPEFWPFYNKILSDRAENARLPVFLAGGCENWSELLENLHAQESFQVLGPTVSQMRTLRDPSNWQSAVSGTGIRFPETTGTIPSELVPCELNSSRSDSAVGASHFQPVGPKWLLKRTASSGGLGVEAVEENVSESSLENSLVRLPAGCYWQRRIEGRSIGASCLLTASNTGIDVQFVGATESWQPSDWPAATEFIYRGSFGPIELSPLQQQSVCQAAKNLISVHSPKQVGWMQFDFIEDGNGQLWLLEANPRWTAGMEVLLLSGRANLALLHAQAHGLALPNAFSVPLMSSQPAIADDWTNYVGKAIHYPTSDVQLTPALLARLQRLMGHGFSDLPSTESAGSIIQAGHPLLTITAQVSRGSHDETSGRQAVLEELYRKRHVVEQLLQ